MKRLILCIPLLILFTSCSDDTIPLSKMPSIIADIYLVDGYINTDLNRVRLADSTSYYEAVVKKHGYTGKQFFATIDKLVERPGKLKLIYEKAKNVLLEEQSRVDYEIRYLPENAVSPLIMKIIYEIDQGTEIDRYRRAVRWITFPGNFIHWKATFSKDRQAKFEEPALGVWWSNNIPLNEKPFYEYEKISGTNFIPGQF